MVVFAATFFRRLAVFRIGLDATASTRLFSRRNPAVEVLAPFMTELAVGPHTRITVLAPPRASRLTGWCRRPKHYGHHGNELGIRGILHFVISPEFPRRVNIQETK